MKKAVGLQWLLYTVSLVPQGVGDINIVSMIVIVVSSGYQAFRYRLTEFSKFSAPTIAFLAF